MIRLDDITPVLAQLTVDYPYLLGGEDLENIITSRLLTATRAVEVKSGIFVAASSLIKSMLNNKSYHDVNYIKTTVILNAILMSEDYEFILSGFDCRELFACIEKNEISIFEAAKTIEAHSLKYKA